MKIAATIARYLLGAVFLFFGSNMFLHFLPMPPLPPGPMRQFTEAMATSHYAYGVAFFQVSPAILLLVNRYVPLALALLAPVIVNICLFHITMAPSGLPQAVLVVVLWFLAVHPVRSAFAGLLKQRA